MPGPVGAGHRLCVRAWTPHDHVPSNMSSNPFGTDQSCTTQLTCAHMCTHMQPHIHGRMRVHTIMHTHVAHTCTRVYMCTHARAHTPKGSKLQTKSLNTKWEAHSGASVLAPQYVCRRQGDPRSWGRWEVLPGAPQLPPGTPQTGTGDLFLKSFYCIFKKILFSCKAPSLMTIQGSPLNSRGSALRS